MESVLTSLSVSLRFARTTYHQLSTTHAPPLVCVCDAHHPRDFQSRPRSSLHVSALTSPAPIESTRSVALKTKTRGTILARP